MVAVEPEDPARQYHHHQVLDSHHCPLTLSTHLHLCIYGQSISIISHTILTDRFVDMCSALCPAQLVRCLGSEVSSFPHTLLLLMFPHTGSSLSLGTDELQPMHALFVAVLCHNRQAGSCSCWCKVMQLSARSCCFLWICPAC
jgi:hypothetical protein